jgi:hypothetical protein
MLAVPVVVTFHYHHAVRQHLALFFPLQRVPRQLAVMSLQPGAH